MYKSIKSELLRREISFSFEDDDFHFQHPDYPELIDCIISEYDGRVRFIADYEHLSLSEPDGDKLCSLINKINYDNDFGNLETDAKGLIVFKLNTFLPDSLNAAKDAFCNALDFFLKKAPQEFRKLEIAINKTRNQHKEEKSC
jgi:hypothetical protein